MGGGRVFSGLLLVSTRLRLFLSIGSGGFSLASFLFRDPLTLHHGRWNLRGNEYTHAEWPVMEEHVGAVLLCVLGRSAKLKGYEWDGSPALQLTATLTLGKVSFEFYFHIYKIERWAADLRASLQVPCSWGTPLWLRQPCRGNNGPNRSENAADRFLRGSRFLQKAQ